MRALVKTVLARLRTVRAVLRGDIVVVVERTSQGFGVHTFSRGLDKGKAHRLVANLLMMEAHDD